MLKTRLLPLFLGLCVFAAKAQPGDIPNAQPGKCYAKCLVRDKFELVTEQVTLRSVYTEMTVIPAQLETVTDNYVSKEAYTRLVAEAPVFETVEEKIQVAPPGRKANPAAFEAVEESILIKPAVKIYVVTEAVFEQGMEAVEIEPTYLKLEVMPEKFETVVEQLEIRSASTKWIREKSDRNCLSADPEDCFVWCLVEVPAQFQTIYKQEPVGCDGLGSRDSAGCVLLHPIAGKTTPLPVMKLIKPAQVEEKVEPAEYQTITKWVLKANATVPAAEDPAEFITIRKKILKTPAIVRKEEVPAQYKPITRKKIKSPARIKYESIPAAYLTVTKRVLVREGGFSEWREIICGEKLTGFTIRQVQEALRALGYYKGPVNGSMGTPTKAALQQFQQDRSLPADGNVDFETLRALGIGY